MNIEKIIQKSFFKKVSPNQFKLIENWLSSDGIQGFWNDNGYTLSDLKIFFIEPKNATFDHYLSFNDNEPFCYFMTSKLAFDGKPCGPGAIDYLPYTEPHGLTRSLDVAIGEQKYRNKGLGPLLIKKFISTICKDARAILIDPEARNKQAIKAYQKAGFLKLNDFYPTQGPFANIHHIIMKKIVIQRS